jgi:hypothetical protein
MRYLLVAKSALKKRPFIFHREIGSNDSNYIFQCNKDTFVEDYLKVKLHNILIPLDALLT